MTAARSQPLPDFAIVTYDDRYKDGVRDLIPPIQQEFGVPITYDDQPDLKNIPGVYQQGSGNFWVALHAGEVIGSAALIDVGGHIGVVRKMFIQRDWRGKGVAQDLFDTLLAWCRRHGIHELYLGTVNSLAAAQRFYQRNGFTEVTTLPPTVEHIRMAVDNRHYYRRLA